MTNKFLHQKSLSGTPNWGSAQVNASRMAVSNQNIGSFLPLKFFATFLVLFAFGIGSVWGAIAAGTYELCTSTSDLEANAHYIIANGTSGTVKCISNVSNNNNRKTVSASVSSSKITVAANSTIMTFTLGGSTGAWTFHTDNYAGTNGYLASASSGDNNYCRVISTSTTGTISFSSNEAVINLNPHSSRKKLRYNTSDLFACYSSGQSPVYLYKLSACNAITPTLSYTSTNLTMGGGNSSSPTLNKNGSTGAVTWSSDKTSVATVNSSGIVTPVGTGTCNITASIAAAGGKCAGEVSVEFTVKRNITYYIGTTQYTVGGFDGDKLTSTLPANPSSCDGENYPYFYGWKNGSISGSTTTAPTILSTEVVSSSTAANTYYAVFTNVEVSDYSTIYTGNVTLPSSGTNASSASVTIGSTSGISALKLGKSGGGGSATFTVPSGTTKLYLHAAGWNGKSTDFTLSTSVGSISPNTAQSLTSNSGIHDNSPFTLSTPLSNDFFEYTLSNVNNVATITIATGSERGVIWGVNATSGGGGSNAKYITTCCTSLAQINGSVSWSNEEATVSWDDVIGMSSWKLYYSAHNANSWTEVTGLSASAGRRSNTTPISGLTAGQEYDFKVTGTYSGSDYCAQDYTFTFSSVSPKITLGEISGASVYIYNNYSGDGLVQTFTVNGVGLTGSTLTVDAPTNFQVSTDNGDTWGTSETIAISNNAVNNATVKVRLASGLGVNSYNGNVTVSGGSAEDKTVAVTGTVSPNCHEPEISVHPVTPAAYNMNVSATALSVTANKKDEGDPNLTYQWKYCGTANGTYVNVPENGTSFTYTPSTGTAGTTYYKCEVSSGACSRLSNYAAVTVNKPEISVSLNPASIAFGNKAYNGSYTETFAVSGTNLANEASITLTLNDETGMYSIDDTDLGAVEVTYAPTAVGTHNASITISSTGADEVIVSLSGTSKYQVTYIANGDVEHPFATKFADGEGKLVLPDSDPTTCNNSYSTFIGWYPTAAGTNGAPSTNISSCGTKAEAHVLAGNETYYAVWGNGALSSDDVKQVTLDFTDNTDWEFPEGSSNKEKSAEEAEYTSGDYTIKVAGDGSNGYYFESTNKYFLLGKSGAYIKLPAFEFATSKIVVTGKAGASSNVVQNIFVGDNAVSDATTGAATPTNPGPSFAITNEYAINSNYQAAGNVYVFKVTSAHNTQVTKIEIYSPGEAATGFISSCCTPLATTSGDVTLGHLATPAAGKLKASWNFESITGLSSLTMQVFEKGATEDTELTGKKVTNITPVAGDMSQTIEGLDPCKQYYVKLTGNKDNGTYCENSWTKTSEPASTLGYAITLAHTNGEVYDNVTLMGIYGADKANACYGDKVTLTPLNESGYHFASWSVNNGAITVDANNQFDMPAAAVTVSATFEANTVPAAITITPNANATITASVNSVTVTQALPGDEVTLAYSELATGHRFVNWSVTAAGDQVDVTNNTFIMPSSAVTVSADIRQEVTVTFKRNGQVYGEPQITYYNGTVSFPAAPEKFDNNYPVFVGWASAISGIGTSAPTLKSAEELITADVEYHAVFANSPVATNNYAKISAIEDLTADSKYMLVGYKNSTTYQAAKNEIVSNYYLNVAANQTVTDNTISSPAAGLTWTLVDGGSNQYYLKGEDDKYIRAYTTINNNKTFYDLSLETETSDACKYTLSVDENAEWTIASVDVNGAYITCSNTNYDEFLLATALQSPVYLFKQQIVSTEWITSEVVKRTVSYNANTEDAYTGTLPESSSVVDGGTHTISSVALSGREGYEWVGWNTDKDATTAQTGEITVDKDIVLYAIWYEIPTYDVKFSVNGSVVNGLTQNLQQDASVTFPDAAAITEAEAFPATIKKFVGWTNEENKNYAHATTAPAFVTSATATENVTYYAVFADVESEDVVDGYNNDLTFPFAHWENIARGQKSNSEAWQMFGYSSNTNPEGEIGTASAYANLVSLSMNAKTGNNSTTLTISYRADENDDWTDLTTKSISKNTSYADYSINLTGIPASAQYIKIKNSTNSFYIKSITLSTGSVSDYTTTVAPLDHIAITTSPNTVYKKGAALDLSGMVVTAYYGTGEGQKTKVLASNKYTVEPAASTVLATTDTKFTVSYSEGTIDKTADQEIHVYALSGIAVTTAPTKTIYNAGESFDATDMVVKATWGGDAEDAIIEEVNGYTYPTSAFVNETEGNINTDITISYTDAAGDTEETTQQVTIQPLANLTMTWNVAGSDPFDTKIYINGDDKFLLALPDAPEVPEGFGEGYEFMGWTSAASVAKDGTGFVAATAGTEMTEAATFHAVFAKDGSWTEYTLSNEAPADGETIIIARLVSGTYYALTTAGTPSTSALTISSNIVSAPADNIKWDVENATNGVYLRPTGVTTTGLHMNSSELKVANGDTNGDIKFTSNGDGSFKATRADNARWIVTSGTNGLTCSATEANAAALYIFKGITHNNYTNYRFAPSTVVVPEIALAEGTYYGSQEVTITAEKPVYYTLNGTIPNKTNGYAYSAPFNISSSCTIKAVAYDSDADDYSTEVVRAYTIIEDIATPTLPTAGKFTTDDKTIEITHEWAETEGFKIYYSYDDETYSEYSEALTITETATIYAYATIGNLTSEKASATYTKTVAITYNKLTSANELAAGMEFLIVSGNYVAGKPYSLTANTTYLGSANITPTNNQIVVTDQDVQEFRLDGQPAAWSLGIDDGKYIIPNSGDVKVSATTSGEWAISIADGGAPTITCIGNNISGNNNNRTLLLNNNTNPKRFKTYATANQQIYDLDNLYYLPYESYTLTYDIAGDEDLAFKVVAGYEYTIVNNDPGTAQDNYTFLHKWTDGSKTYKVGDKITLSDDVTLKPCWKVTTAEAVVDIDGLPESVTEIVVADGMDLNVNDSRTFDNMTVEAGGKVTISGSNTLEVQDMTIQSTSGASGQVTGSNATISGDLYLEIKLLGDGTGTMTTEESQQWYCISAPFDVNMNGGFFWGDGTPMGHNVDFQAFVFDGGKRASSGTSGWQRVSGKMEAGKVYLIGFDDELTNQKTIRLKAMSNTIPTADALPTTGHTAADNKNENWNGVGNPTLHYIALDGFDAKVQCYNNGSGYSPYDPTTHNYVVGTALFMQAENAISLADATNANFRAPKRLSEENEKYSFCVEIAKDADSRCDNRLYVSTSEEATSTYEPGKDMTTMNGTTAKFAALIWTNNYGLRLAAEDVPMVNHQADYELGVYAPKNGTYVIRATEASEDATLYLTKDGNIIWDLTMSPYEAELTKGSNAGYGLKIVAAPKVTTDVEQPTSDSSLKGRATKVIIDEHVFILRGEQLFDVTGKAVK